MRWQLHFFNCWAVFHSSHPILYFPSSAEGFLLTVLFDYSILVGGGRSLPSSLGSLHLASSLDAQPLCFA